MLIMRYSRGEGILFSDHLSFSQSFCHSSNSSSSKMQLVNAMLHGKKAISVKMYAERVFSLLLPFFFSLSPSFSSSPDVQALLWPFQAASSTNFHKMQMLKSLQQISRVCSILESSILRMPYDYIWLYTSLQRKKNRLTHVLHVAISVLTWSKVHCILTDPYYVVNKIIMSPYFTSTYLHCRKWLHLILKKSCEYPMLSNFQPFFLSFFRAV